MARGSGGSRLPFAGFRHSPGVRLGATCFGLLLALSTGPLAGQDVSPSPAPDPAAAAWRTLETEHFRVHFLAAAEPVARAAAARLEALHAEVGALVGHLPAGPIDLVVAGSPTRASFRAVPFAEGPRIILLPSPPAADALESYADWLAVALGHELAGLAHLTRPPEQRWVRIATRFVPFSPLVLRLAPWLPEAYATYVESRLACAGAPAEPLHGALLRRLAAEGRLPDLDELGRPTIGHGELEHADVVGAAFLDWLERQEDRGALARVWDEMARSFPRSFDRAVEIVFGEDLGTLYDRFRAGWEIRGDEALSPPDGEPPLLLLPRAVGAPSLSPDGERLVVEIRPRDGRSRLEIRSFATGEVVAAHALDGRGIAASPRFLADGSVLFTAAFPSPEGPPLTDLLRWHPNEPAITRRTRSADLLAADADAEGRWAVAVRHRWGSTSLTRVDLDTGALQPLVESPPDEVLDAPRISPDGSRLAYLRHRGGTWQLVIRELASGEERSLSHPEAPVLAWPAWDPRGDRVALTVGSPKVGGDIRIESWPIAGGPREILTPSSRIALGPAFAAEGLLYLEPQAEGTALRRAASFASRRETGELAVDADLPRTGSCLALDPGPHPVRPYGLGSFASSSVLGGVASPSALHYVGGVRVGDVIGRWEGVAVAGASDEGAESGGILAFAWNGWRLPLKLHVYQVERRPSQQPEEVPGLGRTLDASQRSLALETSWSRSGRRQRLEVQGAVVGDELETAVDERESLRVGGLLRAEGSWQHDLPGSALLRAGIGLQGAVGDTEGASWSRHGGSVRLGWTTTLFDSASFYTADATVEVLRQEGAVLGVDRLVLGGLPTSLVPAHLDFSRVHEGALPAGALVGDHLESWRLSLGNERFPGRLFIARHDLREGDPRGHDLPEDATAAGGRGGRIRLAGVEIDLDRAARPLLRRPASRVRVGAAYVFDAPLKGEITAWAAIAWSI